jgi:hypothetical protein
VKQFQASNALSKAVSEAADEVASKVINRYKDVEIKGREETITPQIAGELTGHLIEGIEKRIKEVSIAGLSFDAHCYKKSEENKIGADLAGTISYDHNGKVCTKVFLAQAKVASRSNKVSPSELELRAGDRLLQSQCRRMLRFTPDAFVFIYSEFGVHVVPAVSMLRDGRAFVDTTLDYYKELGAFYGELFKCFIGDPRLGLVYRSPKDLEDLCLRFRAKKALGIMAKIKG